MDGSRLTKQVFNTDMTQVRIIGVVKLEIFFMLNLPEYFENKICIDMSLLLVTECTISMRMWP